LGQGRKIKGGREKERKRKREERACLGWSFATGLANFPRPLHLTPPNAHPSGFGGTEPKSKGGRLGLGWRGTDAERKAEQRKIRKNAQREGKESEEKRTQREANAKRKERKRRGLRRTLRGPCLV
jgi:hypothetical protein